PLLWLHLQRLARGQLDQPGDPTEEPPAVEDLAALQFVRPPFALGERGSVKLVDRQREAAQRLRGRTVIDTRQTGDRSPAGPRAPRRRAAPCPATVTAIPTASAREIGLVT